MDKHNHGLENVVAGLYRRARSLAVSVAVGASVLGFGVSRVGAQCQEVPGQVVGSAVPHTVSAVFGVVFDPVHQDYKVTQQSSDVVYRVDPVSGVTQQWGSTLMGDGRGATYGGGWLWFAGYPNKIEKWNENGIRIGSWDTPSSDISGLAYDGFSDSLLVYDRAASPNRILQYSMVGQLRGVIDCPVLNSSDPPNPPLPDGRDIAKRPYDDKLYVTRETNGWIAVVRLLYDGNLALTGAELVENWNVGMSGMNGIDYRADLNQVVSIRQSTNPTHRKIYTFNDGLCPFGDADGNGVVNTADAAPFADALLSGNDSMECDMNQDGSVDGLDIQPFVNRIMQ